MEVVWLQARLGRGFNDGDAILGVRSGFRLGVIASWLDLGGGSVPTAQAAGLACWVRRPWLTLWELLSNPNLYFFSKFNDAYII